MNEIVNSEHSAMRTEIRIVSLVAPSFLWPGVMSMVSRLNRNMALSHIDRSSPEISGLTSMLQGKTARLKYWQIASPDTLQG